MADRYLVTEQALQFAPVNECQKKKLARDQQLLQAKNEALALQKRQAEDLKAQMVSRYEKYDSEYKKKSEEEAKLTQQANATGGFYKPADPKVFLVIRLKGVNKLSPRVRKIFQLFRLLQLHNACFIKVNKATMNMLRHIEPFCTYGYPDLTTIRKLIYKRGYLRVGPKGHKSRVRITDNLQVSELLGEECDVRGVEDIVHEIYTCGPNFTQVNRALWTFKLHPPTKGFVCKRHGFAELRKGDWGNREEYINELALRMI